MKAIELKRDVLKPSWENNFRVIIHIDSDNWYHCHDDEEVPAGSEISLKAVIGLPIPTCPQVPYPHFVAVGKKGEGGKG